MIKTIETIKGEVYEVDDSRVAVEVLKGSFVDNEIGVRLTLAISFRVKGVKYRVGICRVKIKNNILTILKATPDKDVAKVLTITNDENLIISFVNYLLKNNYKDMARVINGDIECGVLNPHINKSIE